MMTLIVFGIIIIMIGALYLLYMSFKGKKNRKRRVSTSTKNQRQTDISPEKQSVEKVSDIYLAGGCFWGVQKYFDCIEGVLHTEVGYANGVGDDPTYEQVCSGTTNFAESVHIQYDSAVVSLSFLLDMYYKVIDPISINKQGGDHGTQYRTGIYYVDASDRTIIDHSLQQLQKNYHDPLAIEVDTLVNFYEAEAYHQDYLDKNPNGYCHIPKSKFTMAKAMKPEPASRFNKPSQDVLKSILTPDQYAVTQEDATESPHRNEYWDVFKEGIYVDVTTGEPLFVSHDKFHSNCGWPSFSKPITNDLLHEVTDITHGRVRTEVRSKLGDAHLGHVFDDGPTSTGGLRYCINSASLRFIPKAEMEKLGYKEYLHLLDK